VLKSRLPEIPEEIVVRLAEAVHEGAQRVAENARDRAPVATGALRESIHTEPAPENKTGPAEWVVAGGQVGDTDVYYGHMVEYGTAHSMPRPFLGPAAEDNRDDVVALGRRALKGL
jgi:HK97 gp10 family phage protein